MKPKILYRYGKWWVVYRSFDGVKPVFRVIRHTTMYRATVTLNAAYWLGMVCGGWREAWHTSVS